MIDEVDQPANPPAELSPAEATAARQAAWRERSLVPIARRRALRQTDLTGRSGRITRAVGASLALQTDPDLVIRLRSGFVALPDPRPLSPALGGPELPPGASASAVRQLDVRSRPPLTRLVGARSTALPTWMSLMFVMQATRARGSRTRNTRRNTSLYRGQESWSLLCGHWASRERTRRARLTRALDDLEAADLVSLGAAGTHGRYEGFRLLDDAGGGTPYRAPRATARPAGAAGGAMATVDLPAAFFTHGWHLVLTPAEVATLLVARHAFQHFTEPVDADYPGVPLTQHQRWSRYGLSPEAYESIHELAEFGLLSLHDPMPHRRRGKFQPPSDAERARLQAEGQSFAPEPYHLRPVDDDCFNRPATTVVLEAMRSKVPPRLRDSSIDFLSDFLST